jgi:2-hydroxy-3-keto-5-methylthiopentenyl-1-phosphate phosphatase
LIAEKQIAPTRNGSVAEMAMLKSLVQCDFDGTITEEDAAFYLLEEFARGDWRRFLRDYKEHRISVREFSVRTFAMIKADKPTLLAALKSKIEVRDGFGELLDYCRGRGFRFVIVSNGLDFYIRAVLKEMGLEDIEVHAAQPSFRTGGMKVEYVGPDGQNVQDGFKDAYIKSFLKQGYRVIYIGNGDSDIAPAQSAHYVFATGDLLEFYRQNNLKCQSFETFLEVVRGLELI